MSSSRTPATRARDTDRIETCARLDAAYADGQLGAVEYFERTEQARNAATVVELASLVGDLQEARPRTRARSPRVALHRKVLYVSLAVAAVVGAIAVVAALRGPLEPSADVVERFAASTESSAPASVPFSPGGIDDVFESFVTAYGSDPVRVATFYPDRAVIGRIDESGNVRNFDFRGTFTPSDEPVSVTGTTDVDLTEVNLDALASTIAQSPAALGGTRVDHVTVADSGAPVISVYVVDDAGAYTGVHKMTFDGTVF
ncbi:hypothetical protein ABH922_004579 [Rhodococcus sp. 27YEA15]|uniref:DUF1707 SHOCT-like domain-containing protein n=1 Tax=Rhodococcus sp. 27YEA15 TaxID=3156259 RepID=UPI003C7D0EC2